MKRKGIKKKLCIRLKDSEGSAYIETLILVIVSTFLLALIISVVEVGVDYSKVVTYANFLASNASIEGQIDTDSDTYSALASKTGLNQSKLTYTWSAQYFDESTHKLAFKQPFSVKVTYSCPLAVFGNSSPVIIPISYIGRSSSEVFWK